MATVMRWWVRRMAAQRPNAGLWLLMIAIFGTIATLDLVLAALGDHDWTNWFVFALALMTLPLYVWRYRFDRRRERDEA